MPDKIMSKVYVSIGSNIEQEKNIRSCLNSLREHFGNLETSTIYENKAVGFEGDNFYNLVAGFDTGEDVNTVFNILRDIENDHGRDRTSKRFSSRTLDIDLLLYDSLVMQDDRLEIPRDEITKYEFVLRPLAELCGEFRHPKLQRTIAELWQEFDKGEEEMWPVELPKLTDS